MKKLIFEIEMDDDFVPGDMIGAPDEITKDGNAVYRIVRESDRGGTLVDVCAELIAHRMWQRGEETPLPDNINTQY
jgi:hypothetical protein